MFLAKHMSGILQSRSDSRSHPDGRLLKPGDEALPAWFGRTTGKMRPRRFLQMRSTRTGRAYRPNAGAAAFLAGIIELARAFGRASQTYFKSRFVRSRIHIDATRYSYASTVTR